jgi:3-oxoacyl-[acyl-carrier protein] reductase
MNLGLEQKRVVITGASRGIGLAIAEQFLEEGANTIICSRGSSNLFEAESRLKNSYGKSRVKATICDCTNSISLEQLTSEVKTTFQGVDIVVSNVGDGRSVPDPLPSDDHWNKTWSANFDSAIQTARAFLPLLVESNGCLLFISSIAGIEAFGAPVDYSTAKAAITALSKNMARKLSNKIRVNVLAPGNIMFPGSSWDEKRTENSNLVDAFIREKVPMQRFGLPAEIADAAVFLCSDRAKFITGAVLVVDGGQTVGIF